MLLKRTIGQLITGRIFLKKYSSSSRTALYDFHVKNGGKIVNFGGYLLPVQYSDMGIVASHEHTRKNASLFDVSHMLQTEIRGKDCVEYFETICTADLKALKKQVGTLTVFTDEHGGILDDLIVTKIDEDHLFVVSNAALKQHDKKHMLHALEAFKKNMNPSTNIEIRFFEPEERSLLAVQGPTAASCLQKITNVELSALYFMNSVIGSVGGVESCRITRCGYTGEDGFEISIPSVKAVDVANALLQDDRMKLAGLGARDSLRLEAGLCLYGNDITSETSPAEAGLMWLIGKRRRQTLDYPGAQIIQSQIKDGLLKRKRVGFIGSSGSPAARHGTQIKNNTGESIGMVSSGCPSPSLKRNISMGYVPLEYSGIGTKLQFEIRNRLYEAVVTKMPFIPTNYYTKPK